ncbi:hypothetical protein Pla8534_34470 [Lignipirellula cremea]|uniref:Uncharacterized protein n=2 Tax=Lignipirellula cremea TaxID=2528010 RepID=A0A518DUW2_9BACT|nr:hypothetical protein Pla8534_34470 [Lignipirellula cremea]
MSENGLSFNARKAMTVHLGEAAGSELSLFLLRLAARVEDLENENQSLRQQLEPVSVSLEEEVIPLRRAA